jgi:hypothetical protein
METETKICQSCKSDFSIEPDDFSFYETIKVPPPTWCPRCRLVRRLAWQGYYNFYKRKCDFTGDTLITTHHPDAKIKMYRQDIWWSDKWDPREYGRDYDFNRPFFEQFSELMNEVPYPALYTEYSTMINSDYCNAASGCKNCYLVFRCTNAEDSAYLNIINDAKNSLDCTDAGLPELCYGSAQINKCYKAVFSQDCEESNDVWFSRDLIGCTNCVGCINLRNKSYCWFNEQLTKEEYKKRFDELNTGSRAFLKEFRGKVDTFFLTQPRRQFHGRNNVDTSGDYLYNCKNTKDSYMIRNGENLRHCHLLKQGPARNSYDYSVFGDNSEWIYDSGWVGLNANNTKFCVWNYYCHDVEYCFGAMSSGNLFGCKGIKRGEYCILNKQYSKEEYQTLLPKIKKHMNEMPFKDKVGRIYTYGSIMPPELSPWAYNESHAEDYFPKKKEAALEQGFNWRDIDLREYREATTEVPDHIKDVTDDMLKAILKCENCEKNYQIIPMELQFLRRLTLPVPMKCPLCRDRSRLRDLNAMNIYDRTCAKCSKAIKTSYASDRKEIVYCEECYQQEIV